MKITRIRIFKTQLSYVGGFCAGCVGNACHQFVWMLMGGQFTTAAAAYLAASTPEKSLINATDLQNYYTRNTGIGAQQHKTASYMRRMYLDWASNRILAPLRRLLSPMGEIHDTETSNSNADD